MSTPTRPAGAPAPGTFGTAGTFGTFLRWGTMGTKRRSFLPLETFLSFFSFQSFLSLETFLSFFSFLPLESFQSFLTFLSFHTGKTFLSFLTFLSFQACLTGMPKPPSFWTGAQGLHQGCAGAAGRLTAGCGTARRSPPRWCRGGCRDGRRRRKRFRPGRGCPPP